MDSGSTLKPNAVVQKLLDAKIDDEIVELRGFVGKVDDDKVRLYRSLRLNDYMDIP